MARTRRTRPTRSDTRRQVLDAAFEVFGERGIAASSLTDVAEAAGLTKGAIYSSFSGKDDLVLALMEQHAMDRLGGALAGFTEGADPDDALAAAGALLVRAMHVDAAWHRLLSEYFAMSHRDPERRDALRLRRREARDAVARALAVLAEKHGLALPLPPDDFAVLLFALSNGLAVESGIDPDGVPDDLLPRVLALLARDLRSGGHGTD